MLIVLAAACQPGILRPPVDGFDAPDPHILRVGGTYYLFTTRDATHNIPVRTSSDLTHWSAPGDALPHLPEWADVRDTWAPAAIEVNGQYILWYAALLGTNHCIDRAVSANPGGPYVPSGDQPFLCETDASTEVIDPYPFRAPDGSLYVYWGDNSAPRRIMGVALDPTGLTMAGEPRELTHSVGAWEGVQNENPAMIATGSDGAPGAPFQLFFSANAWSSPNYATGYLDCASPLGPCTKATAPFLVSKATVKGPGGLSFFTTISGETWAAYHAWDGPVGYENGGARTLHVEPFQVVKGDPTFPDRPPIAFINDMIPGRGNITVNGWGFDPDSPSYRTITVRDFVTGGATVTATANINRPDVVAALPQALTAERGFTALLPAARGVHTVCVAVDKDLTGELLWFSCQKVTVVD